MQKDKCTQEAQASRPQACHEEGSLGEKKPSPELLNIIAGEWKGLGLQKEQECGA